MDLVTSINKPVPIIGKINIGNVCFFHVSKTLYLLNGKNQIQEPRTLFDVKYKPVTLIDYYGDSNFINKMLFIFLYNNKKWGCYNIDEYFCYVDVIS